MALPTDQSHRIAFIKHILSAALDHANLPEPFCSKAILDLHDAVELYVQLIAEHVGAVVPKKADFLEYWPAIKQSLNVDLPQQPAMKRLNQARVGPEAFGHPAVSIRNRRPVGQDRCLLRRCQPAGFQRPIRRTLIHQPRRL